MTILITGGAGFIGSHLAENLLRSGHDVAVIDNFNDFYDPAVKRRTVAEVIETARTAGGRFTLFEGDIRDAAYVGVTVAAVAPEAIIHLAAMAGVRPSIERPLIYAEVNVSGTLNLLEAARSAGVRRFIFASSSSVYGNNPKVPFAEGDPVDHPISPYAATKKAGELLCHTWHYLYGTTIACLRFFTVYGPRQRPDLAIHKFTRMILNGDPLPIYGDGGTWRDYTYIDDIIDGVVKALAWTDVPESRYDIFNLGEAQPVELKRLVTLIEQETGVTAKCRELPKQAGDVERTYADLAKSREVLGYCPGTRIEEGIRRFVQWYRSGK